MPTLYVTAPRAAAADIAETLVEERLVACANRVDCESTYRWEGAVHSEPEAILFLKTTAEAVDAARERVVERHPHDVPCVEVIDESATLPGFTEWRADAVDP